MVTAILAAMSDVAPDTAVVSDYARAALRNARDLLDDAGVLVDHERWPRACSLAVLAMEEAAKVLLCGLLPLLPPEEAHHFALPFAEMNRTHETKLLAAGVMTHLLSYFMGGSDAPSSLAPALEALEAGRRDDNELKKRGFYVGYQDGRVLLPSELAEQDARESLARAVALVPLAESFFDWSADPSADVLAVRGEIWARLVEAFEQGGFDAMAALGERDVGSLTEEDLARIRESITNVLGRMVENDANADS
jgi:AbiV family abortive infection protein